MVWLGLPQRSSITGHIRSCQIIWPAALARVAAAIGSGVAMVFPYLGYSRFVFGK